MTMPLEGIRVLDWTAFQQGPTAGALLADMGADVIKIEEPRGEPGRGLAAIYGMDLPVNFYFLNQNRGKRGMVIDFTTDAGKEVLFKLVEKSDVFLTNYRYLHAEKMGVTYEVLSKHNPRLIYAYSSAWGPEGPDRDLPSADLAGQARGGFWMMSLTRDDEPNPLGAGFADEVGGLLTAYGILLALIAREKTGRGQKVDASLLSGQFEMGRLFLQLYLLLGFPTTAGGKMLRSPLWYYYRCQDDKWFCISVLQADRYWPDVCRVMGIEDLRDDPRFKNAAARQENIDEILAIFKKVFLTRPREEWWQLFKAVPIPSAPVNDCADLANDPQVIANGWIDEVEQPGYGTIKVPGVTVKLSDTPGKVRATAPELGQHTEEVLIELLGYSWDDIAKLREKGVF